MYAGDVWEIFGVVADPASGQTIRIHETATAWATDPADFGRRAAEKLLAAGARQLLTNTAPVPGAAD
jgi:hydroxymethylbilane synthase